MCMKMRRARLIRKDVKRMGEETKGRLDGDDKERRDTLFLSICSVRENLCIS
jgi:hypothetical protein